LHHPSIRYGAFVISIESGFEESIIRTQYSAGTLFLMKSENKYATKKDEIKKRGKRPISRRYDLLPLLPSDPDGVHRELAVWNLPQTFKIRILAYQSKKENHYKISPRATSRSAKWNSNPAC